MSGKLDQALDDIASAQRSSARRRNAPRRSTGRQNTNAPVGGIQKSTKPVRGAAGAKPTPAKATPINKDSKIIVSNLVCFLAAPRPDEMLTLPSQRTFRNSRLRYVSVVARNALGICSTCLSPYSFLPSDVAFSRFVRRICATGLERSQSYISFLDYQDLENGTCRRKSSRSLSRNDFVENAWSAFLHNSADWTGFKFDKTIA